MPRSKLGLHHSVQKHCQKQQFNPTVELILALKEKDDKGNYVIRGKDRMNACLALMNRLPQTATIKAKEVPADNDRTIQIVRQNFVMKEESHEDNPAA